MCNSNFFKPSFGNNNDNKKIIINNIIKKTTIIKIIKNKTKNNIKIINLTRITITITITKIEFYAQEELKHFSNDLELIQ